jgi:hypothetical protein
MSLIYVPRLVLETSSHKVFLWHFDKRLVAPGRADEPIYVHLPQEPSIQDADGFGECVFA